MVAPELRELEYRRVTLEQAAALVADGWTVAAPDWASAETLELVLLVRDVVPGEAT